MAVSLVINRNHEIANFLNLIATYYTKLDDPHRAKVFKTAGDKIRNYPVAILSGPQAGRDLGSGIGPSTETEITSFLETGTSARMEELKHKLSMTLNPSSPKAIEEDGKEVLDFFQSFHGIGEKKAVEYYQMGLRTLEDLWFRASITNATRIAIVWRDHLSLRIPREEMDLFNQKIGTILDPYQIQWMLAGSYRRLEASSGDIDILVQTRPDLDMDGMIFLLKDLIPSVDINGTIQPSLLSKGTSVTMGVMRLGEKYIGHRFDIKFFDPISYFYAVLHSTGSGEFNVLMRSRAKEFGLRLSEYALYSFVDSTFTFYPASSEEEIFELLGVDYLPPQHRLKTITQLDYISRKEVTPLVFDIGGENSPEVARLIERLRKSNK